MNDLYLILHKVRGEPAFDVAQRIEHSFANLVDANEPVRDHIWIIPTSGHRAYPVWEYPLLDLYSHPDVGSLSPLELWGGELPPDIRDHYAASEPRAVPAVRRVAAKPTTTDDFLI